MQKIEMKSNDGMNILISECERGGVEVRLVDDFGTVWRVEWITEDELTGDAPRA